jgi:hypothetical protein
MDQCCQTRSDTEISLEFKELFVTFPIRMFGLEQGITDVKGRQALMPFKEALAIRRPG